MFSDSEYKDARAKLLEDLKAGNPESIRKSLKNFDKILGTHEMRTKEKRLITLAESHLQQFSMDDNESKSTDSEKDERKGASISMKFHF